ncbi:hypothetical protein SIPHO067v1_p0002 [Vibrio phage 51E28.1]|nr:hypothetical protein SIPHO068v1_p0099 [Vibrio phage 51E28.4]QZI92842.1 hypothetical protein SIPHO067v1_p0002 [Vibrio phage 51E28.1]
MKTFLVKLNVKTGDHEKTTVHLVQAEDDNRAKEWAMSNEAHEPGDMVWEEFTAMDVDGKFAYSVLSCEELDPTEEAHFTKHFDLSVCDYDMLTNCGNFLETV